MDSVTKSKISYNDLEKRLLEEGNEDIGPLRKNEGNKENTVEVSSEANSSSLTFDSEKLSEKHSKHLKDAKRLMADKDVRLENQENLLNYSNASDEKLNTRNTKIVSISKLKNRKKSKANSPNKNDLIPKNVIMDQISNQTISKAMSSDYKIKQDLFKNNLLVSKSMNVLKLDKEVTEFRNSEAVIDFPLKSNANKVSKTRKTSNYSSPKFYDSDNVVGKGNIDEAEVKEKNVNKKTEETEGALLSSLRTQKSKQESCSRIVSKNNFVSSDNCSPSKHNSSLVTSSMRRVQSALTSERVLQISSMGRYDIDMATAKRHFIKESPKKVEKEKKEQSYLRRVQSGKIVGTPSEPYEKMQYSHIGLGLVSSHVSKNYKPSANHFNFSYNNFLSIFNEESLKGKKEKHRKEERNMRNHLDLGKNDAQSLKMNINHVNIDYVSIKEANSLRQSCKIGQPKSNSDLTSLKRCSSLAVYRQGSDKKAFAYKGKVSANTGFKTKQLAFSSQDVTEKSTLCKNKEKKYTKILLSSKSMKKQEDLAKLDVGSKDAFIQKECTKEAKRINLSKSSIHAKYFEKKETINKMQSIRLEEEPNVIKLFRKADKFYDFKKQIYEEKLKVQGVLSNIAMIQRNNVSLLKSFTSLLKKLKDKEGN